MSFLQDAIRPGTGSLHHGLEEVASPIRRLRKSQSSYGSLLTPLTRLVRDPTGSIGGLISGLQPEKEEHGAAEELPVSRKEILYLRMKAAITFDEWKTAATELDLLEGNDVWKQTKESPEYDSGLVEKRLKELDEARISCDIDRILFLLRTSLTRDLGGMGELMLYRHSHIGTKTLIERYIESAKETLVTLVDLCDKQRDGSYKKHAMDELLLARQAFGRSALLLSGGGTFGMNHNGVVKALWEHRMLPRIISGSSAGSIVCAVLATRVDAEIPDVIEEFCYGDFTVFGQHDETVLRKAARFLKEGAIFDISNLSRIMRDLLGDMTFQEAYNRTRRILNISVSSAGIHDLPRLLNYITAPNVIIWSAVAASCSVPVMFSSVDLVAKDPKTGEEVPWDASPNRWIDGSVDSDLPMARLSELFNVNHFIVSQVNPHVTPFLDKTDGPVATNTDDPSSVQAPGPSMFKTMANLAKGELLFRMHTLSEMGVLPTYLTKARSILNQKYSGDITIVPDIAYVHFPKVLRNPNTEYMLEALLCGERATWPKLSRVQNHCAIELALDDAVQQLRAEVVFSQSQIDLRLNTLNTSVRRGSYQNRRGRVEREGYMRHRPTRSDEPEGSRSPPQRPRSYLEVRPKRHRPRDLNIRPPLSALPSGMTPLSAAKPTEVVSSSADDDHVEPNLFSEGADDSAETYSSDSDPPSPLPELWPSTRQLFPSVSQPTTPFFSSSFARLSNAAIAPLSPIARRESGAGLMMTPKVAKAPVAGPSSPEARYKQMFHNTPIREAAFGRGSNEHFSPQKETQRDGERMDEDHHGGDSPNRSRPQSRRGNTTPLTLDISGTRGMMRRKRSLSNGLGIKGMPSAHNGPK